MKNKNAQAWGFDLMIGVMIFVGGMAMIYLYTINYPGQEEDTIQTLQNEGQLFSESILSEGSPTNWNLTNVLRPGILSNGKINQTKLELFDNLTTINYNLTKSLFRLKNEYYFYFQEPVNISGTMKQTIGLLNSTSPQNLIKITRVVIYQTNVTTLKFYLWN